MESKDLYLNEDELVDIAQGEFTNERNFINRVLADYNPKDLKGLASCITEEELNTLTVNDLCHRMDEFIDGPNTLHAFPPKYWERFKSEFHDLVCTNSPRYRSVRKSLTTHGNKSQTTIVSLIAAGVAVHVGIAAAALVPFCAICLLAIGKVGLNAFCKQENLSVPVIAEKRKRSRTPSAQ